MERTNDPARAARQDISKLIQRRSSTARLDDLGLADAPRDTLRSIAAATRRPADAAGSRAAAGTTSARTGATALFAGSDRTARENAAVALANEIGVELYRVDLSQLVSKYIGETEKNLRQLFDVAEEAGAVLFFDEADALFGKRSEVKDAHDRYANIEVSYLLERLESFEGLAILATNLRTNIDSAFTRRIRYVVDLSHSERSRSV